MNQEDRPQMESNQFSRRYRRRRTFGRHLQLAAAGESSMATAENWSEVCHSLQEKLRLARVEAETNMELYEQEKLHREQDEDYLRSLGTNFQIMADDLDIIRQKAVDNANYMKKLKADYDRLAGFYYIRDWRCKELWKDLQRLDPSRSGPCQSVIEDSIIVPTRPSDDDSVPPRKKVKEEEQ